MAPTARKTYGVLLPLLLASQLAFAQPAEAPSKAVPQALTPEEEEILEAGETPPFRYITGGLIGTWPAFWHLFESDDMSSSFPRILAFPGFGLGQLVQGRYRESGWIFTVGEVGSILFTYGLAALTCKGDAPSCRDGSAAAVVIGLIPYSVFRAWEVVDLWVGPPLENRRYRELREKVRQRTGIAVFLSPVPRGGAMGGLVLRF